MATAVSRPLTVGEGMYKGTMAKPVLVVLLWCLLASAAVAVPVAPSNAALQLNNMLSAMENVGNLQLFNDIPGAAVVNLGQGAAEEQTLEAEAVQGGAELPPAMRPLEKIRLKGVGESDYDVAFKHIQVMQANVKKMDALVKAQRESVALSKAEEAKLKALIATNEDILKQNESTLKAAGKELLEAVAKYTGEINAAGGSGSGSGANPANPANSEAPSFRELSENLALVQSMLPRYLQQTGMTAKDTADQSGDNDNNPIQRLRSRPRLGS